jgi:hypothetical protein
VREENVAFLLTLLIFYSRRDLPLRLTILAKSQLEECVLSVHDIEAIRGLRQAASENSIYNSSITVYPAPDRFPSLRNMRFRDLDFGASILIDLACSSFGLTDAICNA